MQMERLADAAATETPAAGWPDVAWSVRGEQRAQRGSEPQTWLHLRADAQVSLTCQRCLQPVQASLQVDRWIRLVRDEELAASLDAESDDDVLALGGRLDLLELVEDELLLELPLVPRHEQCPTSLPTVAASVEFDEPVEKPNPFAVLAALKGKQRP